MLATLGAGAVVMGAARASIPVVIPLWADHIGLSAAQANLIFAAAAAIDVTFSYPAGYLMDRFSRRFIAVPSLIVLGAGYVLLPISDSALSLIVAALVLGAGNGLGNGVTMTIGADTAPPDTRAEFLAVWRLMHDVGFFAGPLTVSGVAVLVSLAAAVASMSALSAVGAAIFARYLPTPPLTEDCPQFQIIQILSPHTRKNHEKCG
ncbi:MFS transporter [Hoyosella subflava]|uniref:MFS transporter n=1 Tax=Hoyosella subflava TaxID=639313 RepID=UPI00030639F5|nr:MFS transporter [Hoyosella subflava]